MSGKLQRVEVPGREATARSKPPSNFRWLVLVLLAAGTMINYLDRTVLGIAAPGLSKDFDLSPAHMGVLLSAFSWAYVAGQIPGGVLLDRFGNRLTYFFAVTLWSLFTVLHGFATNLYGLLSMRLGLGVSEAPCFPTNARVVTVWFPQQERARATAIYTVGEYLGLACFGPTLFWLTSHFGWRSMFVVVGAAGILFGLVWWKLYQDPRTDAAHIPLIDAVPFSWSQVRQLLRVRQIWGACLGQFGGNSTLVFFLTWFPTYLATERHMAWIRAGWFSVLPFLAGAAGILFGGWLSDFLLRQTGSANLARKLPMIVGLLGASTIVGANYAATDNIVIAILSVAFFAQGMTGLGYAVISDIAPMNLMGLTGGMFSLAANLAGIVTPLIIGVIIARTGSFTYALGYVGATALLGAVAYIFILGDVHRVEMQRPARSVDP
ncbi:MAG: MFS transporter [Bryobacteraceae bacterium]|jgi:ACS family D-galactonate transporter-like MFS transporter